MEVLPLGILAHVHRLHVIGDETRSFRKIVDLEAVVRAAEA